MKATKDDANKATFMARGFGIEDKDITYMEDWTYSEMEIIFEEIRAEFENFS